MHLTIKHHNILKSFRLLELIKQTISPKNLNLSKNINTNFRMSLQSTGGECTSHTTPEVYVQVLPIIRPTDEQPEGKILLCKWTSGAFQDRYTGMIKVEQSGSSKTHNVNLKTRLASVARELVPLPLRNKLETIDLVGILRFDGPPESDEFIYLATIENTTKESGEIKFEDHPCFWFDWNKIPYEEMPADDAIWYPKVLSAGEKIQGSFVFGGWSERTIKSYELQTVKNLNI